MFTSQRKVWPAVSLTPRSETKVAGSNSVLLGKGKDLSLVDGPPPPLDSLNDGLDKTTTAVAAENMDDWRKFKKAGLLDVAAMERKDREALVEKASRLQSELFDYQYNLGLLLIEKKEWASKYDELVQDLAETEEILKREQSAHLIALSEVEMRGENLKKALVAEKHRVVSLKKAFCEVDEEHAKIKLASQKKLADANALMQGIEEKSLELQKKLDAAESKLAEVDRKSSELEMRMHEAEVRDSVLQAEQMSFITEQEVYQVTSLKEREGLRKWEQKLQEWEERLSKTREFINDKEQNVNENDTTMKQKEKYLEGMKKEIELSSSVLKEREDDVNRRLADLEAKEEEADFMRSLLVTKQEELHQMEENLHGREMMEIQQLLDEEGTILQKKGKEFELKLEEKRQSFDKEVSIRVDELERKDVEIDHEKEKLVKQEQALDKKMLRAKEKEGDLEQKLKSLKAEDRDLKADEKKLEVDRWQMLADRDSLQYLIKEIEEIRAENIQKELQIHEEREKLLVVKEERSEHVRLQCQLMQEIESYRLQNKVVMKEHDELKQERVKCERDWEVLDEKRAEISDELRELVEERKKFEILQQTEDEWLRKEKNDLQIYLQRELANVKQEKELFASMVRNEQQALSEKAQSDHKQLLQDIGLQRKDLESHLLNRQKELDKKVQERELAFEEERKIDQINIFGLKEIAQKEMEQLSSWRHGLEKEREVVSLSRKELIADHLEIRQDIDKLNILSQKLKIQRDQLIQDRGRFLAFVDKQKNCGNCGVSVQEFIVPDLQLPEEFREPTPLAKLDGEPLMDFQGTLVASDLGPSDSGGRMSWLRRCSTKILKLSPIKKIGHVNPPVSTEPLAAQINRDVQAKKPSVCVNDAKGSDSANEPRPSDCHEIESSDVHRFSPSDNIRGVADGHTQMFDDHSILDGKVEKVSEGSQQPYLKRVKQKREGEHKSGFHRTRSVKAAVEDAKVFLGESAAQSDLNVLVQNDSSSLNEGVSNVKKRPRVESSGVSVSEQNPDDSEGCSDSVTAGRGRQRKRRQKIAPPVQTQGEKRYNLRRHKTAGKVSATQGPANLTTVMEKENEGACTEKVKPIVAAFVAPSSSVDGENGQTTNLVQLTTVRTIELTKDRVVRFQSSRTSGEDNASMDKSVNVNDLCDQVNDSSNYEDEDGSTIHDEDEYDEEQPEAASIGKRLWTFFTT